MEHLENTTQNLVSCRIPAISVNTVRDKIHVCYATDGKGTQTIQLITSLDGIRRSAYDPSDYEVHILCGKGGKDSLPRQCQNYLDAFFERSGMHVGYVDVSEWMGEHFPHLSEKWIWKNTVTVPTWYRFSIPDLVNSDKAIYLDCDTVPIRDLRWCVDYDLKGAAIGACEDVWLQYLSKTGQVERLKKMGFTNYGEYGMYIYAGQLVLANQTFKKSGILGRLCAFSRENPNRTDNEALYTVCRKCDVTLLPIKFIYSALTGITLSGSDENLQKFFIKAHGYSSISRALIDASVIHYHGPKTRYYNDSDIGPFLKERWNSAQHFCFPNLH